MSSPSETPPVHGARRPLFRPGPGLYRGGVRRYRRQPALRLQGGHRPVPGTAVYLSADVPRAPETERLAYQPLAGDFGVVRLRYGFMERPSIPRDLTELRRLGVTFDIMSTLFFLGRQSVVASTSSKLARWQEKLFIFLTKNAASPTDFFQIPPGRVVELGAQTTV